MGIHQGVLRSHAALPFEWAVARENFGDVLFTADDWLTLDGRAPSIAAGDTAVLWDYAEGGAIVGPPVGDYKNYVFEYMFYETIFFITSSSAQDAPGGTGMPFVIVFGSDDSGSLQIEIVELNGLGWATTTSNFRRVFMVESLTGNPAAGNVDVHYNGQAGVICARVRAGYNRTHMAVRSIYIEGDRSWAFKPWITSLLYGSAPSQNLAFSVRAGLGPHLSGEKLTTKPGTIARLGDGGVVSVTPSSPLYLIDSDAEMDDLYDYVICAENLHASDAAADVHGSAGLVLEKVPYYYED